MIKTFVKRHLKKRYLCLAPSIRIIVNDISNKVTTEEQIFKPQKQRKKNSSRNHRTVLKWSKTAQIKIETEQQNI